MATTTLNARAISRRNGISAFPKTHSEYNYNNSYKTGNNYDILMQKIKNRTAKVGVIGMGYVGLPNMVLHASKGYDVLGFDVDISKVNHINNGKSYIIDIKSDQLKPFVYNKKIRATANMRELGAMDIIFVDVPTPMDKFNNPDLSFVISARDFIVRNATKGTLIILESTTYPTTTEEYFVNEIEKNGHKIGEDFFVAFSPERIDPGNKNFNIANTPKIVGGHTHKCAKLTQELMGDKHIHIVSSTKAAEMVKILENTFRFINIALVNDMAVFCDKAGINIWEVIDAAKTKPFGYMPFYPTIGIGGHCIPIDPYYLSWYSKKFKAPMKMIESACIVNDSMVDFAVNKIIRTLIQNNVPVGNNKIAILGAAYKKDINDVRESAIFNLYTKLREINAEIAIYDPYINFIRTDKDNVLKITDVDYDNLDKFDAVVLLTDHSSFDYARIAKNAKIIFDSKNAFGNTKYMARHYVSL